MSTLAMEDQPQQGLAFYIVGYPVAKSKSPLLHNTGFKKLGLPHTYHFHECQTITPFLDKLSKDNFGGASLTMPYKIEIIPFLDEITPMAQKLGAVNTVLAERRDGKRVLVGENTDWIGIRDLLEAQMDSVNITIEGGQPGLVLGAGGAARAAIYALADLGFRPIYLRNRTKSKAEDVAASFPATFDIQIVEDLRTDNFGQGPPLAIVGTVPAKGLSLPGSEASDTIKLSADMLRHPNGGVAVEMAYLPKDTPLVQLVEKQSGWQIATGIHVLLQQGYAQFRMWTGHAAPVEDIRKAVLEVYEAEG